MSSDLSMNFTVTYRGSSHPFSLLPDTPLAALQLQLQELTSIPPSLQKLLYKGKNLHGLSEETTISQVGLKNGVKIQMLGSTNAEIGGLKAVENEENRRARIMRERALKPATKLRSTGFASTATSSFIFHTITPLAHLPNVSGALEYLTRLANDPAIKSVMQNHKFSVGELTELFHESPNLLGLNVNAGAQIKLRIRTDANDGFRPYNDVRRVLCHELSHNVHGEHENPFKELNSLLNKEVAQFERAALEGSHTLAGPRGDVYDPEAANSYMPSTELEIAAGGGPVAQTLGGGHGRPLDNSIEGRRQRMLEATLNRMRVEDKDADKSQQP